MEQGHILFPDTPAAPERPARIVPFPPRASRRPRESAGRLSGEGLAQRLRHDVERQIAHRRRMLAHLQSSEHGNWKVDAQ